MGLNPFPWAQEKIELLLGLEKCVCGHSKLSHGPAPGFAGSGCRAWPKGEKPCSCKAYKEEMIVVCSLEKTSITTGEHVCDKCGLMCYTAESWDWNPDARFRCLECIRLGGGIGGHKVKLTDVERKNKILGKNHSEKELIYLGKKICKQRGKKDG